jgi:hypothetical protein
MNTYAADEPCHELTDAELDEILSVVTCREPQTSRRGVSDPATALLLLQPSVRSESRPSLEPLMSGPVHPAIAILMRARVRALWHALALIRGLLHACDLASALASALATSPITDLVSDLMGTPKQPGADFDRIAADTHSLSQILAAAARTATAIDKDLASDIASSAIGSQQLLSDLTLGLGSPPKPIQTVTLDLDLIIEQALDLDIDLDNDLGLALERVQRDAAALDIDLGPLPGAVATLSAERNARLARAIGAARISAMERADFLALDPERSCSVELEAARSRARRREHRLCQALAHLRARTWRGRCMAEGVAVLEQASWQVRELLEQASRQVQEFLVSPGEQIDASHTDLSWMGLQDPHVLEGVVWTADTLWPAHLFDLVRRLSHEIRPGIFKVGGRIRSRPTQPAPDILAASSGSYAPSRTRFGQYQAALGHLA